MIILSDENIPFVKESFGTLGQTIIMPGRSITSEIIKKNRVEVLIVRSVTKVGPELLDGSLVRFVGTATIGTDHVNIPYLNKKNIKFVSAPGSNANSVAEYVIAALLFLAQKKNFKLKGKTLGIIGVGKVGSRVVTKVKAMGMNVLLNDPPMARSTGDRKYLPLKELMKADILTFHVPLNKEGQDATYHLVNEDFLAAMKPGSILINSSRGSVVDNNALKSTLKSKKLSAVVLDVWEKEPSIDAELVKLVSLGTSHIAGYSYDGKVNGTFMVYEELCRFLGVPVQWNPDKILFDRTRPPLVFNNDSYDKEGIESVVDNLVSQMYNILEDDKKLRKIIELPVNEQGPYFDLLRKKYPVRREFQSIDVKLSRDDKKLSEVLTSLGFNIK
ncbi:MAG: 4-phosphoerythronate dehydrogenase [Elusimicrobia bacterium]|nr:4-phosphoerythronate dehydrogenase [Elusimicrobiota bacterium]